MIKASSRYDSIVSLGDFMATVAQLTGQELPDNVGEDSVSLYLILNGDDTPVRESIIHHSIAGKFAVRKGDWKLILCSGSGGFQFNGGSGYPCDNVAH